MHLFLLASIPLPVITIKFLLFLLVRHLLLVAMHLLLLAMHLLLLEFFWDIHIKAILVSTESHKAKSSHEYLRFAFLCENVRTFLDDVQFRCRKSKNRAKSSSNISGAFAAHIEVSQERDLFYSV